MADGDAMRELLERAVPLRTGEASAWQDVLRRAVAEQPATTGARRRPRLVLVAVLVAVVAAAVPTAVALRSIFVDFVGAEHAPLRVERSFASMERGSPVLRPGAIASETRKILDVANPGRTAAVLYVAPTIYGGFCWTVEDPDSGFSAGGCGRRKGGRMHAGVPYAQETSAGEPRGVFAAVSGRIRDHDISRIELHHSDGYVLEIPIVWVSDPIGVGFFVHPIPAARWNDGKPVEVVALAKDGRVVKREPIEFEIAPAG